MSELKRFRNHIQSLKQLIEESDLDDDWKQVARDAVLSWIAETSEEDWIKGTGVTPAEVEYLRNAGVWPWRRES